MDSCRYATPLDKAALAFLQDHSVKGQRILPATAMLEAAVEACSMLHNNADVGADSALKDTSILRAVVLKRSASHSDDGDTCEAQVPQKSCQAMQDFPSTFWQSEGTVSSAYDMA